MKQQLTWLRMNSSFHRRPQEFLQEAKSTPPTFSSPFLPFSRSPLLSSPPFLPALLILPFLLRCEAALLNLARVSGGSAVSSSLSRLSQCRLWARGTRLVFMCKPKCCNWNEFSLYISRGGQVPPLGHAWGRPWSLQSSTAVDVWRPIVIVNFVPIYSVSSAILTLQTLVVTALAFKGQWTSSAMSPFSRSPRLSIWFPL